MGFILDSWKKALFRYRKWHKFRWFSTIKTETRLSEIAAKKLNVQSLLGGKFWPFSVMFSRIVNSFDG